MATRTEYNNCMRPYISGSKPKEERKRAFCVGAKICSGKATNEEEALQLCAKSVPKWVRQALPKDGGDNLSCEERITRAHETIDAIVLGLKAGDIEEMVPACAQVLSDVTKCRPGEVAELAEVAVQEVRGLSKRYYLKGEAKDAQNKLAALKELL